MFSFRVFMLSMYWVGFAPLVCAEPPLLEFQTTIDSEGRIEQAWTFGSVVGAGKVLSIVELERVDGKVNLTDGHQSVWFSRAAKRQDKTLKLVITPATDQKPRSYRYLGAAMSTASLPLAEDATIQCETRTVLLDSIEYRVLDIVLRVGDSDKLDSGLLRRRIR